MCLLGYRWGSLYGDMNFEMFVFIIKYCRRKGISYIMTLYCRYINPIVWGARRARLAADGSLKIGQTQTTQIRRRYIY